jgi:hypothetical protein
VFLPSSVFSPFFALQAEAKTAAANTNASSSEIAAFTVFPIYVLPFFINGFVLSFQAPAKPPRFSAFRALRRIPYHIIISRSLPREKSENRFPSAPLRSRDPPRRSSRRPTFLKKRSSRSVQASAKML